MVATQQNVKCRKTNYVHIGYLGWKSASKARNKLHINPVPSKPWYFSVSKVRFAVEKGIGLVENTYQVQHNVRDNKPKSHSLLGHGA